MVGSVAPKRTVIFLVQWPVTPFEEKRWGFSILRQAGFDVKVYDLSRLINARAVALYAPPDALKADYIRKIESYGELDSMMSIDAPSSVFVDYITGYTDFGLNLERVFRCIKKNSARYLFVSSGPLPITASSVGTTARLKRRLLKALNPASLADFIVKRAIVKLTRMGVLYPKPYLIFGGESEPLSGYLRKRGISEGSVVPVHTFDYDTYLDYVRGSGAGSAKDDTCVFLDEAATHHSDFAILGISPVQAGGYYAAMNALFNAIEKNTGLKVVVAAHPKSCYEKEGAVFGGRPLVKGKTLELVAKSSLVVAHGSTSVSFAVLFDKPVLFVKTADMSRTGASAHVDAMAASIGRSAMTIAPETVYKKADFDIKPKGDYETYKYKYVKSRSAEEKKVWEIIAGRLATMNER